MTTNLNKRDMFIQIKEIEPFSPLHATNILHERKVYCQPLCLISNAIEWTQLCRRAGQKNCC